MGVIPVVQVSKTRRGGIRLKVLSFSGTSPTDVLTAWERVVEGDSRVIGAMLPTPPAVAGYRKQLDKVLESSAWAAEVDIITYIAGHINMTNRVTEQGDPVWQFVRNVHYGRN